MTELVKKGKSKSQIKKEHKLFEKENEKRMKEEEAERIKRGLEIFQEWKTQKCSYCGSLFNIKSYKDIQTECVYGGSRNYNGEKVNRYDKYVKCPNCRTNKSLDDNDIPSGIVFPTQPSNVWYLLPLLGGIFGGIIGYFFLSNKDSGMAKNQVILGLLVTIVSYILQS